MNCLDAAIDPIHQTPGPLLNMNPKPIAHVYGLIGKRPALFPVRLR